MADIVHCDVCRKSGWRKLRRAAPAGWYFAESADDDDPENVVVIYACSDECKQKFWKRGPGFLSLSTGVMTGSEEPCSASCDAEPSPK